MLGEERWPSGPLDVIGQLRWEVSRWFQVRAVQTSERGDRVMFMGRLVQDAEPAYRALRERFRRLGYTLLLRRQDGEDVVLAQQGAWPVARFNPLVNVVLLGLTLITTLLAGAGFAGVNGLSAVTALWRHGQWQPLAQTLLAGAPFALTLLGILGVHEMGHYLAARWHGVQVSLPYFIPVPFGLGTFGAFIQMKSPVEDRKALFDVGVAGPLAGFFVALPLMVVGLLFSSVVPATGGERLGTSLLVRALTGLILPHAANEAVRLSPVAIAAWFGLLVTGFNLLPIGQLDGGHLAYAVLGRAARPVGVAALVGLVVLGFTAWNGWWTWAALALFTGLAHAEPLNDITPLDWPRRLVALFTAGIFILVLTLRPF